MATEIILMQDVTDLGVAGDIVTVKDGFARNYLFPRRLAAPVTDATRRRLAKIRREREAAAREALAAAQRLAERLTGVSVTLPRKTTDGEHLYGSVGTADIAAALAAQGYDIARDQVLLDEPIKAVGVKEVTLRLGNDVTAAVKVWIVEE